MRVLRTSMYPMMHMPPMTTVMRECDAVDGGFLTVEALAVDMSRDSGVLVLHKVYDIPLPPRTVGYTGDALDIEEATLEVIKLFKYEQPREMHMSTTYHWCLANLRMLTPLGTMTTTLPSPCTTPELWTVLSLVKVHPAYRGQIIAIHDNQGIPVKMKDGEILK